MLHQARKQMLVIGTVFTPVAINAISLICHLYVASIPVGATQQRLRLAVWEQLCHMLDPSCLPYTPAPMCTWAAAGKFPIDTCRCCCALHKYPSKRLNHDHSIATDFAVSNAICAQTSASKLRGMLPKRSARSSVAMTASNRHNNQPQQQLPLQRSRASAGKNAKRASSKTLRTSTL